MCDLVDAFV